MISSCVTIMMRDVLRGIPCGPGWLCQLQTAVGLCACTLGWGSAVKNGHSLWWSADTRIFWIADSAVYHTPPRTAVENATPVISLYSFFRCARCLFQEAPTKTALIRPVQCHCIFELIRLKKKKEVNFHQLAPLVRTQYSLIMLK